MPENPVARVYQVGGEEAVSIVYVSRSEGNAIGWHPRRIEFASIPDHFHQVVLAPKGR